MSRIIANTYEIEREIGSGGGGVVFLANHVRLNKQVVLKGDKRSLTAKQETLRREVDSLKNLSQTYIPQVYDYVSDGEMVYTVMDYVEGESFNKALKRGETFHQARIVSWAKQLLEAVSYLHRQPPHGILHADIKPANIMLTPQDDIRLIDFNIALMLGEEGAIAVGKSFGYASPEHYGIDLSSGATTRSSSTDDDIGTKMVSESDVKTVVDDSSPVGASSSSGSGIKKLLDVRSDIYSVGATLYHFITGKRPKRNAQEVAPILRQYCSLALAVIVEKAMNPNPDLRYQSAEEMLYDVQHLRDNDHRVRRWKRTRAIACLVLSMTFLAGGITAFAGSRQMELEQRTETERQREETERHRIEALKQKEIADAESAEAALQKREARIQEMRVLAASSAEALRTGDKYGAIALALEAVPNEDDESIPHLPEAKKALADALGVYDLSDGFKPHRTVTLPTETLDLAIAPDGSSFAAMSLGRLSVFETWSGALLVELSAIESGLASVCYADGSTIVFAGSDGLTVYDLAAGAILWIGDAATTIVVSSDGGTIAAINRDDAVAKVYRIGGEELDDVEFANRRMWVPTNDRFGNPGGNVFALNHDGTKLAVSFSNGGLEIFDLTGNQRSIELFDESEYTYFEGGFHGKYFAFSATNDEESLFAVIDTERLMQTISTTLSNRIGAFADESGVYMSVNNINALIDPVSASQTPIGYDPRGQIAVDYRIESSLNSPIVRISMFQSHNDKEIFAYDRSYAHNEARLSAKDDRVMLFSYKQFRIYDIEGGLIIETPIPDAGQVYDQQYRRHDDESLLEVTYYDGTVHLYSSDDGSMSISDSIPPPDASLEQKFETDDLMIIAPLHGTPSVFSSATGLFIRELEKEAYLTYVTQVGDYVITEYISADGDRYGLLLDGKTGEALAHIPNLSDIIGERLIVDIRQSGSLRETRLYSTAELIDMAHTELYRR